MASSAGISIDVPQATIAALRRAMDRAGTEFGKSVRSQVKIAAWSIGKTLGTATRVADRHIPLARVSRKEAKLLSIERRTGLQSFIGTKYFGGKAKQITIFAKGIAAAKRDIRAQNYRFGLAKLSWRASIGGLGSQAGMGVSKANAKTLQKAMQRAAVARNLKGDNPSIMVGSYLPYTQDALIGGPSAIAPAIDRAARMMMHNMDSKAAKLVKEMATA
jgi:hypothetical protein